MVYKDIHNCAHGIDTKKYCKKCIEETRPISEQRKEMESYNESFHEVTNARVSSKRIITCNTCRGSGAVLSEFAESGAMRCYDCYGTRVKELRDVGEFSFPHLVFDPAGKLDDSTI